MAEHLSLITTPIQLVNRDIIVSSGTGFYYVSKWAGEEHIFLATNYHVLTGNSVDEKNEAPKGDRINFFYHLDKNDPSSIMGISVPLFTNDNEKIWIEHENNSVDIAVIPLPYSLPMTPAICAIDKTWSNIDMKVFPSDPITLIGYPRMFLDRKNSLPIYKTGSVASEPSYDFDGKPFFIIDISAFGGNSGSPVFAISNGSYVDSNGNRVMSTQSVKKFLGVYSAGYSVDQKIPIQEINKTEVKEQGIIYKEDLQLGVVWKNNLIQEMIDRTSLDGYRVIAEKLMKSGNFKYRIAKDFTNIL